MKGYTIKSLIILIIFTFSVQARESSLTFGIISVESQNKLEKNWQPLLSDVSKKLGVKVNPYFAKDYSGIIDAMRDNKVDVAWCGNLSAMDAVDRANAEIFAQTVPENGHPGYWGLLIAHKDSELKTADDVIRKAKDIRFGFGDKKSTSGYLAPAYYVFSKSGINVARDFKKVTFLSHELNALNVASKKLDAASSNNETMERIKINHPKVYEQIKVIWKSPLIPSDPLIWRKDLSSQMKADLKNFFLNYAQKSVIEQNNLRRLGWKHFISSNEQQLNPIRQLWLFYKRNKLISHGASASDMRVKKIDQQLKQLSE